MARGGPAEGRLAPVSTIGRAVTPRGTDWSLALLVSLGLATGLSTWFAGSRESAWVFAAHAALGTALALVLVWKLRRVWRRILAASRWDGRTGAGLAALALVAGALGSGVLWSSGANVAFGGMSLLGWHVVLGLALGGLVLAHALARAQPLRAVDARDRRQLLAAAGVGAAAVTAWALQRPAQRALGLAGAHRRFTGSYATGSFAGDDFPVTSWVADRPRVLDAAAYRLRVRGAVDRPGALSVADLDRGDELVATLDCTGGFASTQRWRGVRLGRLLPQDGLVESG